MTPQPNQYASGLRRAIDLLKEQQRNLSRAAALSAEADPWTGGRLYQLGQVIDTLSDQLIDAGGFLGDAPEPEERAFIIDRNGQVLEYYEVDELDPDIYAEQYAQEMGFDIDYSDGLIPDGCEDFSVKIAEAADSVRCWSSRNYMIKGE